MSESEHTQAGWRHLSGSRQLSLTVENEKMAWVMGMDLFVAHHVKSSRRSKQILTMKEVFFSSVNIKSLAVNLPDSRRRERDNEGRGMCIGHSAYVLLSFIISLRSMGSLRISKLSMKMESMNKIRKRHVDFRCKILAILQGDEHCFFFMLCFYWHFAAVDLGPCLRNERVVWCFLTRFHWIGVNRFNLSDAGWCTCLKVWAGYLI